MYSNFNNRMQFNNQFNNQRNTQSNFQPNNLRQNNSQPNNFQNNNTQPDNSQSDIRKETAFGSSPNFMHNQKLSGIDPVKLKIIMEIREKSKNKSVEELLPEIMKINQELNRRNMNFSKNESEILMDIIEESLSPADRQKFNMLKGFMS